VVDRSADSDSPAAAQPSWEVVAAKRRLREQLDAEIGEDSRQAILDSRAADVPTAELAALWGVSEAWIYTIAPVRHKSGTKPRKTGSTGR
jgi:hypothetical protein